ncbi:DUF11 domain-containing protein [Candidatus Saccharibacteria bacterium]|nr:DUF11 domain-containing protein [Candidatus Saccharibacteria bacterium]
MNKVFKSIAGVAAAAVVAAAALTPVLVVAWGDNTGTQEGRPSYTLDEINAGKLGDKITFNSISNGKIGDEKNFVGAKVAGATVSTWNANEIKVKDGETYTIRLFVHNNSPRGMQAIAKGVKATFSIPTNVAKTQTIVGYLDSTNATPTRYFDEVKLVSDENIYLEYVDGSAMYNNNKGDFKLPNEVITSGALVGYESMNGEIPGCFEYSGVVTINVKVHSSVAAKLQKKVRIKGTKEWSESVDAKIGDEVEYQIEYQNLLAEKVNDVMIRDVLPTNVEYVNDSTTLYNASNPDGLHIKENTIATTGINIGNYTAKSNAYVRFTGKVVDKTMDCGKNQLVNWAAATVNASSIKNAVYKDDASVMVDKTCKNPEPTPVNPDKPVTPDNPGETPTTIVNTGAGTIATGAIGAGSMVTTLGYYLASRKKLM